MLATAIVSRSVDDNLTPQNPGLIPCIHVLKYMTHKYITSKINTDTTV